MYLHIRNNVCKLVSHRHMMMHSGEKESQSTYCIKSTCLKCKLSRYMNVHTAVIIHICIFNYKHICQNYNIKIYMRIHTGEEPCQCYFCDKAFLSQSALENCSKSHSSEKFNLYVLFNLSQIIHNEITH